MVPAAGGPSGKDPAEDAAEVAARARMRQDVEDALSALLAADETSFPGWLRAHFGRVVRRGGLRTSGGRAVRRPDLTGREWLFDLLGDMSLCEELLAFREAQCGYYDVRPQSCNARVCPDCERRRSARLVDAYSAVLADVPARRRSFGVLTLRNVPFGQLSAGFDRLAAGVVSLRRRPVMRGGRCRWRQRDGTPGHPCPHRRVCLETSPVDRCELACHRGDCFHAKGCLTCAENLRGDPLECRHVPHRRDRNCPAFRHDKVDGGIAAYETTVNVAAREWHPHVNLVMDAPFIPQAELADTWRAVTCSDLKHRRAGWCPAGCDAGSFDVWIKQLHPDPRALRETIKYVTKSTDLIEGDDPLQLVEFLFAVRGRRMIQGWGSFFGVKIEHEDVEETVTLEDPLPGVFRDGVQVVRRYRLPRFCHQCGRDTKLEGGGCTYEAPVGQVLRTDARLRNGYRMWRPPPRSPARLN